MENLGIINRKPASFLPLAVGYSSKVKPPNLARAKARKRADNSLELGFRLRAEAEKQNDVQSLVDADLLIESGQFDSGNHVHFENLLDSKGRSFSAPVQFIALPTRLDSGSQRKNAWNNRKRIVEQFEAVEAKIKDGELFAFFITPTFPNLTGKTIEQNVKFIDEVARRFRDEDYYKNTILGAFKKTEFTSGKSRERRKFNIAFDYRIHGYNFHNHYLCVTSVEFADTSQDCKKYCRESHTHIYNRENKANRKLTKLYTKILKQVYLEMFGEKLVFDTESGLAVVDVRPVDLTDKGKGIFYESSKYLAKSSTFNSLEASELLSANKLFRNKKLISSTGIFTKKTGRKKETNSNINNNLRDKETSESLDKQPSSMFEKVPSSILDSYFDSACKTLSLKNLGIKLCENGARELWLKLLKTEFQKQVQTARRKFLERHPNAVVTDLQGNCYGEHRKIYSDVEKQLKALVKTRHLFRNTVALSH